MTEMVTIRDMVKYIYGKQGTIYVLQGTNLIMIRIEEKKKETIFVLKEAWPTSNDLIDVIEDFESLKAKRYIAAKKLLGEPSLYLTYGVIPKQTEIKKDIEGLLESRHRKIEKEYYKRLGSIKSEKKAKSSAENGKLGGRPKKNDTEIKIEINQETE